MSRLLLIMLLMLSAKAFAGGSSFELEVISFTESEDGGYKFSFYQLNHPYRSDHENYPKQKNVLIKFGCSQGLACFFSARTFSKEQHNEAITKLKDIAKPGEKITIGVMSDGFVPIKDKQALYRSYGSFISDGMVFLYANSHL